MLFRGKLPSGLAVRGLDQFMRESRPRQGTPDGSPIDLIIVN
jgi:hypothetical protein